MILTVCLSPCVDVNIEVNSLSVGMTHTVISKRIFFTGKALNVATGLARLGVDAFATGFMYEDNGSQFEQTLHREGISYKFVWNSGRVRENYKFIDNKSMLTEINDISPAVSEQKQEELLSLIRDISRQCEAVVLTGGLTRGMSPDFYGKILDCVPDNVIKVVDCDGERLCSSLKSGVDLIKPNLEEIEKTLKRKMRGKDDLLNGCRRLIDMGAKTVLCSLGKHGAVITDGIGAYYCKSINVAMNSTIGAGDGMVAAATYAMTKGESLQNILKMGVAAGTASVTTPDSISFNRDKYEEILASLTVKDILQ